MKKFEFATGPEAQVFCCNIVRRMSDLFQIPEEEAIGRMNRFWKGLSFDRKDDLIFHETEDFWANTIYYGRKSKWWKNPADLKPLPYP
ncbi:MAG: hypothetical protein MRJ68_12395 [Nitrospira sp.]|nr:hypothetical protein [Nitrospira sp.]